MEILSSKKTSSLSANNLVRIGDLLNYEGPLLTLFEDLINGHFYIFDWVDRDSESNRWLIYKVTPQSLKYFINGKYSHYDLFKTNDNKILYLTDIKNNQNIYNSTFFELTEIPIDYIPNNDYYFNPSSCSSIEIIKNKINKALYFSSGNEYIVRVGISEHFNRTSFKKEEPNRIKASINVQLFENRKLLHPINRCNNNQSANNLGSHKELFLENNYHRTGQNKF